MRNYEKINSLIGSESIDEQAIRLLLYRISEETGIYFPQDQVEYYVRLYCNIKNWMGET